MSIEEIAAAFKELGHPTRLKVFQRLIKAGYTGLPVGEIQSELNIPGSTLSHHISGLVTAGLIKQRRESRTLFCVVEFEKVQHVTDFLLSECCLDEEPTN